MQVASKELSEELYGLSGWLEDHWFYTNRFNYPVEYDLRVANALQGCVFEPKKGDIPAYDAGFLLRKLPSTTRLSKYAQNSFRTEHDRGDQGYFDVADDTPEDALCKLAIELFKAGILQKGEI